MVRHVKKILVIYVQFRHFTNVKAKKWLFMQKFVQSKTKFWEKRSCSMS